jgi:hypothetical protein
MLRRLECLRPWLLCLFLIAQIGGVIPLVYVDTLHEVVGDDAAGTVVEPRPSEDKKQPAQHHTGIHDEHDQCCALHHGLIGLLWGVSYQPPSLAVSVSATLSPTTPPSSNLSRLERPPRASLLS